MQLSGKRALIVGASRGIGAATAGAFADAGARVAIAGRSAEALADVAAGIAAAGDSGRSRARPITVEIDVRSEASVDAGIDAAAERLGGLDVVVDAAGISPVYRRVAKLTVADWDAVMETNARGAFLVARAASRHLLAGGAGALIFITSIHEEVGGERLAAYAASKGAVRQLARSLALEWAASGVRVNCIAPAYAETDLTAGLRANEHFREELLRQTPTGRWIGLDEIAAAAVYLASDSAASVTGSTLTIDGGWTAR